MRYLGTSLKIVLFASLFLGTSCAVRSRGVYTTGVYTNVYDKRWFGLNKSFHIWISDQPQDADLVRKEGEKERAYIFFAESFNANFEAGYFIAKVHKIDHVINGVSTMPTIRFGEPKEIRMILGKRWPSVFVGEFTKHSHHISLYSIDTNGRYQIVIPRKKVCCG